MNVRSGPAAGITIVIDPQTEKFFWTGSHEVPIQHALARVLRPGMRFWDVGAHTGFFSFLAARLVGPGGRVDAFEPVAANRRRLEAAIPLNAGAPVHVHELALARTSGSATLYGGEESVTWSLVGDDAAQSIVVACSTLDELGASLPQPDVLKIDAEGSEVDILRGGERLFRTHRPTVVVELEAGAEDAALELLPSYAASRLDSRHWLFQPAD